MPKATKFFLSTFLLLAVLMFLVSIHYFYKKSVKSNNEETFLSLTTLPSLGYRVTFFENRFKEYKKYDNQRYKIEYLDYVYK
jgi:hypothetical protein